jgi:hypothetical protein
MSNKRDMIELLAIARAAVKEAEADAAENPTSDELQIVVVEPFEIPYKRTIPNTLEAMQEIVGGYIENVTIGRTKTGASVGLTINEEGKLIGLPFNRRIINFDTLAGTFFITAYNLQGDNVSLSDEEADYYIKRFQALEVYL